MDIKNKIVRFWRGLNKNTPQIEVWDTSAIIKCLAEMQEKIELGDNLKIVIPEGVFHELSVGRHKFEKSRNAYKYIMNTQSDRLVKIPTDDNIRLWTIDEQVVYVVADYHEKGYDVTLVTCDRDQAFRAELKGLKAHWIDVNIITANQSIQSKATKVVYSSQGTDTFGKVGEVMKLKCEKQGKELYVPMRRGMSIFDSRGKRKIGKDERIRIANTDTVRYYGVNYHIESIADSEVVLKKNKA